MTELPEKKREKMILDRFNERGVVGTCPRCGRSILQLIEDIHLLQVQSPSSQGTVLGGPSIPTFVTFCNNCGFVALHTIGALGFIKEGKVAI